MTRLDLFLRVIGKSAVMGRNGDDAGLRCRAPGGVVLWLPFTLSAATYVVLRIT